MSQKLFLNTGRETIKGGALHALKDAGNAGAFDFATMTVTTAVVDATSFTLGEDEYEVNLVATDNTLDTGVGGEYNNTSPVINIPVAGLAVGDVILIESEFMIVIEASALSAFVSRGFAGSTIATHGNSITIFEAVQQVGAGNLALPVSALANATSSAQIATAVQFWTDGGYTKGLGGGIGVRVENSLKVEAISPAAGTVLFAYPADGGVAETSDGLDSVTVNFTDGGTGEDFLEATDGTDFVELGVEDGEVITIGSAVANDGAYTVTGVDRPTYDEAGVEVTPSKISVATGSWTDEAQADAITIAQADAFTNGVLTAFAGGVEPAGQQYSKVIFKTTGTGALEAFAPFDVTDANVTVYGADGALIELAAATVSIDGSRLVTVSAVGGQVNGGTVKLEMYG